MSTTTDNLLLSLINTKDALKAAIEAKGVTVGAIPFDEYADKIKQITPPKGIHLTLSTNQGPNTGSRTVLFNTIVKNDGGFALDTGVITVTDAGWYLITAKVDLTTYSSTIHAISILDNTTSAELLRSSQPNSESFYGTLLSGVIYLAAGASIKITYYTGTSTTILASTGGQTLLTIVKL